MIIDAHAHISETLRPCGPRGEGRALGGGLLQWPDGAVERFFPRRYGDRGFLAETLLTLMRETWTVGHHVGGSLREQVSGRRKGWRHLERGSEPRASGTVVFPLI